MLLERIADHRVGKLANAVGRRLVYACLFEAGAAAESASTVVVETVPGACEVGSELGTFVDASTHNGD